MILFLRRCFFLFFLTFCTPLTTEQQLTFISNHLHSSITHSNLLLESYYKPAELVMASELRNITDDNQRQKALEAFDSLDYFILRLSINDHEIENEFAGNPTKLSEIVNYFNYYIRDDISLVLPNETFQPLDIIYSQAFGSANATTLMIVFQSNLHNKDGTVNLVFSDSKFGTGTNEFKFDCSDIKAIPRLKFD